uniref:tRNA1(Val) (adenine(37)-N6)-methyltransferase n=1 Tax=Prevotella sp. TaxID=59823 RepID=UPI0040268DBA
MAGFKFKHFEIHQDRCAMKVGTDGVLLGAWALGGKRILDIGSGTGLISLMMAQRYPEAQLVGIDLDAEACAEARENVAASPFADRVNIVDCRLQDYESVEKFDAIVSNPPFFLNSLKNPDSKRSMARHADSLPFRELFRGVKLLLSDDGVFSAIVPVEVLEAFASEGYMHGFYLLRQCGIKTVERKQPKRYLLTFAKHRCMEMDDMVETMMDSEGNRSEWYAKITEEFYVS